MRRLADGGPPAPATNRDEDRPEASDEPEEGERPQDQVETARGRYQEDPLPITLDEVLVHLRRRSAADELLAELPG